jgi:hypothetical protein
MEVPVEIGRLPKVKIGGSCTTWLARLTAADSRKFCLRLLGCQPGCTIVYYLFKKCAHFGDWF